MEAISKRKRNLLALATSAVGVVLACVSQEPTGFLIIVAALWMSGGSRAGLVAVALTTMLFSLILFYPTIFPSLPPLGIGEKALRLTVFALSAFGLWLLLQIYRSVNFFDQVHRLGQPTAEDIPGLGWSTYPDGRMRFINPAALDFIGISAEEMRRIMDEDHHAWWKLFVHPDDVERSMARWDYSLKTGEPLVDEQRVRRYDGTYRWFRDSAVASRDERGNITGWYGTTVDIDDQKRAEAALRTNELQLRRLIDTVPALIWCAGSAGEPSYVNRTLASWSGLSLEDIKIENSPASIIVDTAHPDDRRQLADALAYSFSTGRPFACKYRQRRADGAYRWIDGKAEPLRDADGSILQWYGVCLDITEEVEAHQAVQEREQELRVLVDTVPALIWLITPTGSPHYFNKRFVDWSGVSPDSNEVMTEAAEPITHMELIHPEDRQRVADAFQHSFATGEPLHVKARLRRKDGQYRWVDSRVEPLRDQGGHIIRWYGVSFIIEEEVRAQMALRESQRYLQHLIDTVPVGIFLSNPDGEPIYVNKRLMEYHGLASDKLADAGVKPGKVVRDFVHPDDRDALAGRLAHCYKAGESFAMRYRQRRADGVYRWVEGRSEPFRDDEGVITQWYGVNLDVDDEVRAQESLRLADERLARASRAASLSELSVSIAHELNQPLQAVVSNANAFQRWLNTSPPNFERANRSAASIIRNADAAAQVVSRIRALFAQSEPERQAIDFNTIIEEVCELVSDKLMLSHIKLHLDLEPNLPAVVADRVQIEQVVLNLLRNAIEAMQKLDMRSSTLTILSRRQGKGMLKIEFRDQGPGIDDLERIFDPFFTTKKEGIGMGLSICRSVVESHGGSIWAENLTPRGAAISFMLPFPSDRSEHDAVSRQADDHQMPS